MYFKIIAKFRPESGDSWTDSLRWRRASFFRFDSVDGAMRPDLFDPNSRKDWDNCVNEDYKFNLITNVDYAREVLAEDFNYEVVGVDIELGSAPSRTDGLLGFDIMDSNCTTSLLTNWGVDDLRVIDEHLESNGLIAHFEDALMVRNRLRAGFSEDAHAARCTTVWAIYDCDI